MLLFNDFEQTSAFEFKKVAHVTSSNILYFGPGLPHIDEYKTEPDNATWHTNVMKVEECFGGPKL